jgi:hypothetical protein
MPKRITKYNFHVLQTDADFPVAGVSPRVMICLGNSTDYRAYRMDLTIEEAEIFLQHISMAIEDAKEL